jgi:hypothetical protein
MKWKLRIYSFFTAHAIILFTCLVIVITVLK